MTLHDVADAEYDAYLGALIDLADVHPGGRSLRGADGTMLLVTGADMAALNGVFVRSDRPDPAEIDRLARMVAGEKLPWSIVVRGDEPPSDVLKVAAKFDRTRRNVGPHMVCSPDEARLRGPGADVPVIRTLGSAEQEMYNDQVDIGFGTPSGTFATLMAASVIDAQWATAYVASLDGVPVATGYGVHSRGTVGVFNITTAPECRGRGYGRLITERVMTDGFDAGATMAYLQSSTSGRPLYESMGFRTVQHLTYLG
jgi:GNAT superfamily N-acetyltransferase